MKALILGLLLILAIAIFVIYINVDFSPSCSEQRVEEYYLNKSSFEAISEGKIAADTIVDYNKARTQPIIDKLRAYVNDKANLFAYHSSECGADRYFIRTEAAFLFIRNHFPEVDKAKFDSFFHGASLGCSNCIIKIVFTNTGMKVTRV